MKLYNLSEGKYRNINPKDITIAVYGLGKMGLPLAAVFANKGFQVIGTDINKNVVEKINKGINPVTGEIGLDQLLKKVIQNKTLSATGNGISASKKSDVKIILVPIFIDNHNNPDMTQLNNVVKVISKGMQKGDIVILESTAPPGTTEKIAKTIEKISGLELNKDFSVAHCPERTSSGTAILDIMGRLDPKIVGGSDNKTTEIVKELYKKINRRGVVSVKNTKVAELVKIWEGIYRDVNIAFANNLYLICKEFGVDANEIIRACNTDIYSHILEPGPGVGGHCIPVYPYFILKKIKSNKKLINLARKINDSMSTHTISLAQEVLAEKGKKIKNASILVLGLAYRSGVKETRKSPGIKIAKELKEYAKNVFVYDPLFNNEETKALGLIFKNDFNKVDCIIITTNEKTFKKLNWKQIAEKVSTKTIIDTQNVIDFDKLQKLGFSIRRIGYAK